MQVRQVENVMSKSKAGEGKKSSKEGMQEESLMGATQEDLDMIAQRPILTYADTFLYEYPSNQIYFLTQKQFGVYVYCNWKLIADLLKVEQRYECAMNFLIAMHKKANKFDLGLEGSEKELSQYIQVLSIDFINKKLGKIKDMPEIIENLINEEEYFKMLITPIEFLTETEEFTFLFEVVKDKIISCLSYNQTEACLKGSQVIFYTALIKFIQHGRIKFIPETQMQNVLNYFVAAEQLDMVDKLAIYFDLTLIDRNIVIQSLLNNHLVVSLAHICTQGNQSQFVTPFVKFWGISENHKRHNEYVYAQTYAFRALWYVKLCLQRNWVLKEYSFEKYAKMITILSQHFLNEKIITGLLEIRPNEALETLSFYFTIQNSQIINQMNLKLGKNEKDIEEWIAQRQGNEQIQILLSSVSLYIKKALKEEEKIKQKLNLFLSTIIIYKTVAFTERQYYQILEQLIKNYSCIKEIGYGLEEKMIKQFNDEHFSESDEVKMEILSARYINKILTLVYYQCRDYIHGKLTQLYQFSSLYALTDLKAQISFLQGNYSNCVAIYKGSKEATRILLFEFLENSFKRLILEKRKEQKNLLANEIKKEIKYMVTVNPQKTKEIIHNYVPQIQEELINALRDDQDLQLEYLEGIVGDQDRKDMKMKLSERSILRFVELMAKFKPQMLIEAFKKNPHFSIEESLKICEQYEVYDCMEYLYERMGSIAESVKIAALRIDRILKNRNNCDEFSQAPYIKIKEILDNAIEVCKKNHSEDIWESLLDSSIDLYHKYLNSQIPEDEIEIFFYINGEIMENLASNCSIEHTIELLQTKYNNLNMGGKMTKAFINILSNLSHSINILYIATNLIQVNLQRCQEIDYHQKLRCYHTENQCETCGYAIVKRDHSLHFRCGHCYHKECVVYQDPMTCVACLMDKTDQFSYYLNTLNPQYPKIKKVKDLFDKFEEKKFEMSETFKIEEFEKIQKKEDNILQGKIEKKKIKFQRFDENMAELESGNRRVLHDLNY